MEGEQKVDLPLDGELDVKSSDMLVSVNQAKLAHNRQRWQGHVLPSSVRFEHDGWAAGDNVYNLSYVEHSHAIEGLTDYYYKKYAGDTDNSIIVEILHNDDIVATFCYTKLADNKTYILNSDLVGITVTTAGSSDDYIVSIGNDTIGEIVRYSLKTGAVTPATGYTATASVDNDSGIVNFNIAENSNLIDKTIENITVPSENINMHYYNGSNSTTILKTDVLASFDNKTGNNTTFNGNATVTVNKVSGNYTLNARLNSKQKNMFELVTKPASSVEPHTGEPACKFSFDTKKKLDGILNEATVFVADKNNYIELDDNSMLNKSIDTTLFDIPNTSSTTNMFKLDTPSTFVVKSADASMPGNLMMSTTMPFTAVFKGVSHNTPYQTYYILDESDAQVETGIGYFSVPEFEELYLYANDKIIAYIDNREGTYDAPNNTPGYGLDAYVTRHVHHSKDGYGYFELEPYQQPDNCKLTYVLYPSLDTTLTAEGEVFRGMDNLHGGAIHIELPQYGDMSFDIYPEMIDHFGARNEKRVVSKGTSITGLPVFDGLDVTVGSGNASVEAVGNPTRYDDGGDDHDRRTCFNVTSSTGYILYDQDTSEVLTSHNISAVSTCCKAISATGYDYVINAEMTVYAAASLVLSNNRLSIQPALNHAANDKRMYIDTTGLFNRFNLRGDALTDANIDTFVNPDESTGLFWRNNTVNVDSNLSYTPYLTVYLDNSGVDSSSAFVTPNAYSAYMESTQEGLNCLIVYTDTNGTAKYDVNSDEVIPENSIRTISAAITSCTSISTHTVTSSTVTSSYDNAVTEQLNLIKVSLSKSVGPLIYNSDTGMYDQAISYVFLDVRKDIIAHFNPDDDSFTCTQMTAGNVTTNGLSFDYAGQPQVDGINLTCNFSLNSTTYISLDPVYLPFINDSALSDVSIEGNVITFTYNGKVFKFNYVFNKLSILNDTDETDISGSITVTTVATNVCTLDINYALRYYLSMYISKQLYNAEGVALLGYNSTSSLLNDTVKLKLDNIATEFAIDINDNSYLPDTVVWSSTDLETNTDKTINKVLADSELQIVKQQWDTTNETENFWWLDESHILVLTKYEIILKVKEDTVDDWNGDKFTVLQRWDRTQYIDSTVEDILCSSVYKSVNMSARLALLKVKDDHTLLFELYNPLNNMSKAEILVHIECKDLGVALNDVSYDASTGMYTLYTYSKLSAKDVASQADISFTIAYNTYIIGIHYDNNFNQWAVISSNDTHSVIQGYGYVGHDGSLTGGEIPFVYFDISKGFSGTVHDVALINADKQDNTYYANSVTELYKSLDIIYGNDTQQWYVSNNIDSIVSHITFENDSNGAHFVPQRLYLNNNYSAVYASGSYASKVIGDKNALNVMTLTELIENSAGTSFSTLLNELNKITTETFDFTSSFKKNDAGYAFRNYINKVSKHVISAISDFNIYSLLPILSNINYLQQTIGQYAYVHYNSTDMSLEKDLTKAVDEGEDLSISNDKNKKSDDKNTVSYINADTEVTFDNMVFKQAQSCDDTWPAGYLLIINLAMSALDFAQDTLRLNNKTLQTAIPGISTSGQYMAQAMNSMSLSDLTVQKVVTAQTSEVSALKSLDMFYSTSCEQHVYAGPGYVNHNFVAQCVAQSMTSTQIELKQQKMQYILKMFTEAEALCKLKMYNMIADGVKLLAPTLARTGFAGIVVGTLAATFSILAAQEQSKYEFMESVLNSLGANDNKLNVTAMLSKHTYDVEGKHKYGSSNKSFMWPCFGCVSNDTYTDEYVEASVNTKLFKLDCKSYKSDNDVTLLDSIIPNIKDNKNSLTTSSVSENIRKTFVGDIPYYIAMCKGKQYTRTVPSGMAYILGVDSFLSHDLFKNESIGENFPVFTAALTQDYLLDNFWQLGITATGNGINWITVKDTKVLDGAPSNVIISNSFCGVASPYAAIEVKRGLSKKYTRPVTVTPSALAINCTGYNSIFESVPYHAFDGYGSRVINMVGKPGMGTERFTMLYSFLINDRFKRSNKIAPNQLLGNFRAAPNISCSTMGKDKLYKQITVPTAKIGLSAGVPGEDKDVMRYAIPLFTEHVNTLPAAVKTFTTYTLATIEGITSLCTDLRNTLAEYKNPVSVDFNIGEQLYRVTKEYICKLTNKDGFVMSENLVPILGLSFLGASPYEAYFYSQATRLYYVYTGGTSIKAIDMIERFRDVQKGYWDFVNQEVVLPCIATFNRLDSRVYDDENETDNIIIPVLKDGIFKGEVAPPVTSIFNNESWYKVYSLPTGVVYQGPNRCIVNRYVMSDYMIEQIKSNKRKWKRLPKEEYHPFRQYNYEFTSVLDNADSTAVNGWTHNPFLLVTAPLGINEETDCKFEWEVTFAWTNEMEKLYDNNEYACVNIIAETMTPGGKVFARPTHVYLTKELFTRSNNFGYYSFRYQSNNGIGNRERLHIWADSYIAVSSVQLAYKPTTTKRNEILTQQVDVQGLIEM